MRTPMSGVLPATSNKTTGVAMTLLGTAAGVYNHMQITIQLSDSGCISSEERLMYPAEMTNGSKDHLYIKYCNEGD